MIHIGISGPIAAGKSTLAKQLKQLANESGYGAEVVSFATGIREIVALEPQRYRTLAIGRKLFDWGISNEKAQEAASRIDQAMRKYPSQDGIKNRRLLQTIGTEIGREYLGPDIWIYRTQQLLRKYEVLDFAISDDLRFDNEAMAVDVHIAIDITGREDLYSARTDTLGGGYTYSDHASEKSLTLPPLFTVPIGFTAGDVLHLFDTLDYVRRLRY